MIVPLAGGILEQCIFHLGNVMVFRCRRNGKLERPNCRRSTLISIARRLTPGHRPPQNERRLQKPHAVCLENHTKLMHILVCLSVEPEYAQIRQQKGLHAEAKRAEPRVLRTHSAPRKKRRCGSRLPRSARHRHHGGRQG
jgi:hypothetical protein